MGAGWCAEVAAWIIFHDSDVKWWVFFNKFAQVSSPCSLSSLALNPVRDKWLLGLFEGP